MCVSHFNPVTADLDIIRPHPAHWFLLISLCVINTKLGFDNKLLYIIQFVPFQSSDKLYQRMA